jgi:hypothetical protein
MDLQTSTINQPDPGANSNRLRWYLIWCGSALLLHPPDSSIAFCLGRVVQTAT